MGNTRKPRSAAQPNGLYSNYAKSRPQQELSSVLLISAAMVGGTYAGGLRASVTS